MPAIIPPDGYGRVTWTDIEDNWRQVDAFWLQDRSVIRYASAAARSSDIPVPQAGTVTYLADDGSFQGRTPTGWARFVASTNLRVSDAGTSPTTQAQLSNANGVGGIVLLQSGEVRIVSTHAQALNVGGKVWIDNSSNAGDNGLWISTGGAAARLRTSAAGLDVNRPVLAPGVNTPQLVSTGTLSVSGTSTLAGVNATSVGATSVSADTVTSAILNATTATVTGSVTTGLVRAPSSGAGQVALGSGATLSGGAVLLHGTSSVRLRRGSSLEVDIAGIVASSSAPSGNYPDGTLWLQV